MSVYIKGMEMPKYCNVCPMQLVDKSGELTYCVLTRFLTRWWEYDRRQSSEGHCPLVPVPDHGRLIDESMIPWCVDWYAGRKRYYTTPKTVGNLPTIIPAEPVNNSYKLEGEE